MLSSFLLVPYQPATTRLSTNGNLCPITNRVGQRKGNKSAAKSAAAWYCSCQQVRIRIVSRSCASHHLPIVLKLSKKCLLVFQKYSEEVPFLALTWTRNCILVSWLCWNNHHELPGLTARVIPLSFWRSEIWPSGHWAKSKWAWYLSIYSDRLLHSSLEFWNSLFRGLIVYFCLLNPVYFSQDSLFSPFFRLYWL